jgi:hypothetical protein
MLEILGVDGVEIEPETLLLLNIMGGTDANGYRQEYANAVCTVSDLAKGGRSRRTRRWRGAVGYQKGVFKT